MRTTRSAARAGTCKAWVSRRSAQAVASASVALPKICRILTCRIIVMTISEFSAAGFRSEVSGLRRTPHRLAHGDLAGDQAEMKEAVGVRLLGRDDVVGQLADGGRPALGGQSLDVDIDTGAFCPKFPALIAMRFGPVGGFRQRVDDGGDQLREAHGEIAVGDVERIGF